MVRAGNACQTPTPARKNQQHPLIQSKSRKESGHMKTAIWTIFLIYSAFELSPILADAPDPTGWLEIFSRAGAVGIMGTLIGYLLVKHIPTIETRHESREKNWREERDAWRSLIKERDDKLLELLAQIKVYLDGK